MFQKESLLEVFELQILVWILTDPVIHESINVRLTGCYERVMDCCSVHRRRLHRGNRELRPGTHARTGANVAFCPGTFHGCALIFKV